MRDIVTKVDGTTNLSAGDWNANQSELENIVNSSDQTLDPAGGPNTDLNMLAQAAAGYAGAAWAYQDSGSANTYVLSITSNLKPITKYFDNLMVAFKPGNDNTGASTVNVEGLGAKAIKVGGTDPTAGEILTTRIVILKYNLGADYFELVNPVPKIVQTVYSENESVTTGITLIPVDDTKPRQSGPAEGDEYMTLAITPKNSNHKLLIEVNLACAHSSANATLIMALFQNSIAESIKAISEQAPANADASLFLSFQHEMTAGTTSPITFKIRAGGSVAGTFTFNGLAGSGLFGGALLSTLRITEYRA